MVDVDEDGRRMRSAAIFVIIVIEIVTIWLYRRQVSVMRFIAWLRSSRGVILVVAVFFSVAVLAATSLAQEQSLFHLSPYMVETENDLPVAAEWINLLAPENRSVLVAPTSPFTSPLTTTVAITATAAMTDT